MPVLEELEQELGRLRAAGLLRSLEEVSSRQGPEVALQSQGARAVVNVCSNDYLSLAGDRRVIEAGQDALEEFGAGAGAARLIVGNLSPHARLETALARFLEVPEVLLFSSGYHANLGTIPVIAGEGDLIVSDALNHASLIDGCRLSRADVGVYPHGDLAAVERALSRTKAARRVILTESLFSMDGDLADLAGLWEIALRHEAILYVDEAHALGVLGPDGKGAAAAAGLPPDHPQLVRMGTLGKAFGSYGAFIAAHPSLLALLRSRSRGFLFTTGIPPSAAAAASAALEISREEPERRIGLLRRSAALRAMLAAQGWEIGRACAQIVPLPLGDPARTMAAQAALLQAGIFCRGIRPPTVPPGTSRLRVSLNAGHTDAHLTLLARALEPIERELRSSVRAARRAGR